MDYKRNFSDHSAVSDTVLSPRFLMVIARQITQEVSGGERKRVDLISGGLFVDEDLSRKVFLPTLDEALTRMEEHGLKLAHYTSFETAKLIIDGRAVWMRDARFMNDVGEIQHGIVAMDAFLADDGNQARIAHILTPFSPDLPQALQNVWAHFRNKIFNEVYITCFSEHWPEEDTFGRLSMWRAYCAKPDGVAIVMNTAAFRLKSNALNAYASPVFYGTSADFAAKLHDILSNIEREAEAVATLGPKGILDHLAIALLFGAVCLKHPGFYEEEEWRVIHMPSIDIPNRLKRINLPGPPAQTVYAIPLEDFPPAGLVGIEPDALIAQVIIGPSDRAGKIGNEMEKSLTAQGVQNARDRIFVTGIPLRVADH